MSSGWLSIVRYSHLLPSETKLSIPFHNIIFGDDTPGSRIRNPSKSVSESYWYPTERTQ